MVRRKSLSQEVNELQGLPSLMRRSLFYFSKLGNGRQNGKVGPTALDDDEKEKIEAYFEQFRTYKYFEFPDITPAKLRAMTTVKVNSDEHGTWFYLKRLSWSHRSGSRMAFNKLLFFMSFYGVLSTPVFVAFGYPLFPIYRVVLNVLYFTFAVDLLCNFFTSFMSADGRDVRNHKYIAVRYLKTWFLLDLFACLPWWLYQRDRVFSDAEPFRLQWAKIVDGEAVQLKHPFSGASWFQLVATFLKFLRELLRMRRSGLSNESDLWHIISILSMIVSFMQCCAVVFFACTQEEASQWIKQQTNGDWDILNNTERTEQTQLFIRYSLILHGTIVFVLGKGEPTTAMERWYGMFLNIIGLFITATLVGQVTHLIQKYNAKETKWRLKMGEVNDSMMQMGINEELQTRIRNYYAFSWAINGGEDKGNSWLGDLSKTYHEEAKIQVNEKLIASVPIFREANKDFVHAVIMKLKQQLYLPGDYIIKFGEIGDEMYFLVRGTVQAMDEAETTVYTVLNEGSFFGEIALLKTNSRRTATVRAYTYAQLNVLYKNDFEAILREFPEDALLLEKEARLREKNSANVMRIKQNRLKGSHRATMHPESTTSRSSSGFSNADKVESRVKSEQTLAVNASSYRSDKVDRANVTVQDNQQQQEQQGQQVKEMETKKRIKAEIESKRWGAGLQTFRMLTEKNLFRDSKRPKARPLLSPQKTIANLDADGEIQDFSRSLKLVRSAPSLRKARRGSKSNIPAIEQESYDEVEEDKEEEEEDGKEPIMDIHDEDESKK